MHSPAQSRSLLRVMPWPQGDVTLLQALILTKADTLLAPLISLTGPRESESTAAAAAAVRAKSGQQGSKSGPQSATSADSKGTSQAAPGSLQLIKAAKEVLMCACQLLGLCQQVSWHHNLSLLRQMT